MLVDKVIEFYDKEYDLNCAECMLVAANHYYDLGISKETIKVLAPFGGGMGIESVCGAVTGGLAVIGVMFTEERGHQCPWVKEMTVKFINLFNEELGTLNCDKLKSDYRNDDDSRCIKMMIAAANSLEKVIDEAKESN